jgi:hypothetical protein
MVCGKIICGSVQAARRQRRGVQLFQFEAGVVEYELAKLYAGLQESDMDDKAAVSAALGRLLRRALVRANDR